MSKAIDYSLRRYGRLQPLAFAFSRSTPSGQDKKYWLCQCDCGSEAVVWAASLQNGDTKSCGCLRKEMRAAKNHRHGASGTAEYQAWSMIKRRCLNVRSNGYENYGGRGITMCARWLESFENFFADVGPRPSQDHSIDRIENDGNYEPNNVHWATPSEQMNNMRKSVKITLNGITKTVAEWSRLLKLNPFTIYARIDAGWEPERALIEPVRKWPSQKPKG